MCGGPPGGGPGWFLRLTELAVIASLVVGGLELRVPWRDEAWRAPVRLAGPGMLLTMAGLLALLHGAAGWTLPVAMLGAAILAPTDRDRMRYGLS